MEAIAELARETREQKNEIAELKTAVKELAERVGAHGLSLTTPHRRDVLRHYEDQLAGLKEAT
jgi:shikimate 5-dehydrogenase